MININGHLIESENATVALDNRGLNYGDAIFETMRFADGKLFFWKDHYRRLISTLGILKMEVPNAFKIDLLEQEILRTVRTSNSLNGGFRIKLLVWRKTGGKYEPISNKVEYAITFEKLEASVYILKETKYEIALFKDHLISSGILSSLKTNNKLVNILGSIFAKENGYENCLLLNENQRVVEALNGNVFLIFDDTIFTPPITDGCLNGIMRKHIISIAKKIPNYKVKEVSVSMSDVLSADEIFITNVIQGIVSVSKFREKTYGNEVAGIILPKLNKKVINS